MADETDAIDTDAIDEAARSLYAGPPDQFLANRAELVEQAKAAGDGASAKAIARLRKPTNGAWIVNALVRQDPGIVVALDELGGRLRAAQDALDAGRMRELTTERRALVADLTRRAFHLAGYSVTSPAQSDEVFGTFDAAIADPEIATRLGKLQRPEQWSGFGFTSSGPPQLKLVHGGKTPPTAATPTPTPTPARISAAERRQRERQLKQARDSFELAQTELDQALTHEQELMEKVRHRERAVADAKESLDLARHGLENIRDELKRWRRVRREARAELDRVERATD